MFIPHTRNQHIIDKSGLKRHYYSGARKGHCTALVCQRQIVRVAFNNNNNNNNNNDNNNDDARESAFLFQRLSVAIQRFNAVCVTGTLGTQLDTE
jgi:hypothetical protein